MKLLLTIADIKLFVPIKATFPSDKLEKAIFNTEIYKFENIAELGLPFHAQLEQDLTANDLLSAYSPTTTYVLNEKVSFGTINYISLQNSNLGKMNTHTQKSYWKVVPKFQTASNNDLWEFLGRFLAFEVIKNVLTYATYDLGDQGATKYSEDFRGQGTGIITVEKTEFATIRSTIISDCEMALSNLLSYMRSNNINNLPININGSTNPARRIGRRIFLKS